MTRHRMVPGLVFAAVGALMTALITAISPATALPSRVDTVYATSAAAPGASVAIDTKRKVKLPRTGGKVPVRVTATPVGSRLKLTLRVHTGSRWIKLANKSWDVQTTKTHTCKLRVPPEWRAEMAGTTRKARVTAVLRSSGGDVDRAKTVFRLRT